MNYLFDTNVCIELMRNRTSIVAQRYQEAVLEGSGVLLPLIVVYELLYGIERSEKKQENSQRLEIFLGTGFMILPLSIEDVSAAARVRATLQAQKQPIGPYDTLIAGQPLARNLTLITANTREFTRVEGLTWQDWSQP